ncbi:MAG: hypothetical protein WA855_03765 [Candidatus Acidiferrales bacterium]
MKNKSQSGMALATSLIVVFLIVALVIGFSWMVLIDQRLGGVNGSETYTFYGAEAGLEKLTGDLGNLFASNSSPSGAQVNALAVAANEPNVPGVDYLIPSGAIGYNITFPVDGSGNPEATDHVIESGNYQGMTGLLTPYTLTVTAHNAVTNAEVRLTRTVQTVAIPVFQFGMFSQTDLSFFPGPDFDFGGNVMTNGNLFLAGGADLVFNGKVLSAKDIIVSNLSNGWPTSTGYTGAIYAPTTSGGCPSGTWPSGNTAGCQQLTQGSLVGTIGSAQNAAFPNLAKSTYNSYIGSSETGVKAVNLSITLAPGANPIDLIRRPVASENTSNPELYSQRYYAQASMRIMLSDNSTDLSSLPCVDTTVSPTHLGVAGATFGPAGSAVPIAESGAVTSSHTADTASGGYGTSSNGYWLPNGQPLITGYIKIEIQTSYPTTAGSCGTWKDVTSTVLGLGIAGRNLNPNKSFTLGANSYYSLPALFPQPGSSPSSTSQIAASTCADINLGAIIRLERMRDNPSNGTTAAPCGTFSTSPFDYWPNMLFDTREGNLRDLEPPTTTVTATGGTKGTFAYYQMPTAGGVMNYTELDITQLVKFLTTHATGMLAKDAVNSTNDFTIYFSDRRGNYDSTAIPGGWPPASPSTYETGEYGFEDSINPSSGYGCPDGVLDTGETFDMVENPGNQVVGGVPEDYGETSPSWPSVNGNPTLFTDLLTNKGVVPQPSAGCTAPTMPWPGAYIVNPEEARQNPPLFFRRALKIVNGSSINLGTCPDGVACGLTIVSENPVYVQDDFNAAAGGDVNATPNAAHVATSVIADSVTLLSDSWNDVNSFIFPYYSGSCPASNPPQGGVWGTCGRNAATTNYRFAVVAGKGISFPQPSTCGTGGCYQDFGTDGGVHNFIRMLENWGGQTLYYRGSVVSFYYSRQAIGVYKDGLNNTVYQPPTRGYSFDSDFLTPSLLPPRTPMFRDVNTVGFSQVVLPTP